MMFQQPSPNPEQITWHTSLGDIIPRPSYWSVDAVYPFGAMLTGDVEIDLVFMTGVLVNSGFKPYILRRADTRVNQVVWARPVMEIVGWRTERLRSGQEIETEPITEERLPDLSVIIAGEVNELPIRGRVVERGDTILLGAWDGGSWEEGKPTMINVGGRRVPELLTPNKIR